MRLLNDQDADDPCRLCRRACDRFSIGCGAMAKPAVRAESGTTAWVFQERTDALPPTGNVKFRGLCVTGSLPATLGESHCCPPANESGICSYLSELGIQAYAALIRPDVPAL
jgi:hypothetical protein